MGIIPERETGGAGGVRTGESRGQTGRLGGPPGGQSSSSNGFRLFSEKEGEEGTAGGLRGEKRQ